MPDRSLGDLCQFPDAGLQLVSGGEATHPSCVFGFVGHARLHPPILASCGQSAAEGGASPQCRAEIEESKEII